MTGTLQVIRSIFIFMLIVHLIGILPLSWIVIPALLIIIKTMLENLATAIKEKKNADEYIRLGR